MAKNSLPTLLFLTAVAASPADAASPSTPIPPAAVYQEECGSCHVAYPPRFLPRASWDALLDGLSQHFGQDASVEPATLAPLRAHLDAGAREQRDGDVKADGTPILRITESRWFQGEHRRFTRENVWQRPSIGSPANCGACHREAAQGKFGERGIQIPK